jgi:ATP-binding cassette, subfamily B, multidrug efflux pump
MGQATDCFLVPAGSSAFAQLAPQLIDPQGRPDSTQETVSSCWLGTTEDPSTLSFSRQIIYNAYHLGGYTTPELATATNAERIEGMFRLILVIITLYVIGAVLTGATFFTMAWTGQHVLRVLRVEVFEKLHTSP